MLYHKLTKIWYYNCMISAAVPRGTPCYVHNVFRGEGLCIFVRAPPPALVSSASQQQHDFCAGPHPFFWTVFACLSEICVSRFFDPKTSHNRSNMDPKFMKKWSRRPSRKTNLEIWIIFSKMTHRRRARAQSFHRTFRYTAHASGSDQAALSKQRQQR